MSLYRQAIMLEMHFRLVDGIEEGKGDKENRVDKML